jgi:hypothetical protein
LTLPASILADLAAPHKEVCSHALTDKAVTGILPPTAAIDDAKITSGLQCAEEVDPKVGIDIISQAELTVRMVCPVERRDHGVITVRARAFSDRLEKGNTLLTNNDCIFLTLTPDG